MIIVSVVMITYNHESYIKDAITGILNQVVNFDYELIIADDCSTDNTEAEIRDIIQTHHNNSNIKYTRHRTNKGMIPNFVWALEQTKGEYIALCEGDDYWTDPYKLQKQVDFLKANRDYTLCAHQYLILNNDGFDASIQADSLVNSQKFTEVGMNQLIHGHPFATHSIVFRNYIVTDFPIWFKNSPFGDYVLYFICASQGKLAMLNQIMGVYRKHGSGIYTSLNNNSKGIIKNHSQHIKFYKLIRKELKSYFTSIHDYLLYESILMHYNHKLKKSKEYNNINHYFYLLDFLNFKLNEKISRYFGRFKIIKNSKDIT